MGIIFKTNYIMFTKVSLLAAAVVYLTGGGGMVAGKLHCDDCTRIGNLVSDEIQLPANIQTELEMIEDAVCADLLNPEDCKVQLALLYGVMAPTLFGRDFGWFSPTWMCQVECQEEAAPVVAAPKNLCQDCKDKLVARNSAMADEASILTVLDAFQYISGRLPGPRLVRCQLPG